MKVLYVFTFGYSLKTWFDSGTLEKELLIFKKINKEKGVNFYFLTYGTDEEYSYLDKEKGLHAIPIFEKNKIPSTKFRLAISSIIFCLRSRKKFQKINIIQQNQLNGSWVSILIKLITKKPLIYRSGYDTYRFSVEEKKSFIKKTFFLFLTNLNLLFADIYTVTSKSDLIFSNRYAVKSKNVYLRPNFIDVNSMEPKYQRFENKILTVGRLENQKNYEKLINDFANSDFTIDIVGEGSRLEELKKLAVSKNTNVNFMGKIPNSKLQSLYTKYLFYVSTSLFEGNPKTVLEAMSHGCIALISNIDNHKELIIDNENGFLVDAEENFKDIIIKIKHNKEKIESISSSAQKYVTKNNNIERIIDLVYSDYVSIAHYKS